MLAMLSIGVACETVSIGRPNPPNLPGVVPKPARIEAGTGTFRLTPKCRICYDPSLEGAQDTAEYLAQILRRSLAFPVAVQAGSGPIEGAVLLAGTGADASLGKEGYILEVTPRQVQIRATTAAGLFYGVQTFRQLLPAAAFGTTNLPHPENWAVTSVRVVDTPRFEWRGMHLDVSRHFFDVDFVKRFIDNLAALKMNVFHWHLTDDDGWRVEIKKYPRLTEIGAWRGPNEALPPSYESGNRRYGGFYTQEQIREVIRYAAQRHVLIVPEVDVPAHSRAATVVYPDLLCTGDPYKYKSVQDVPANVLCPSQERTYEFLEGVFGELAELFPGPYLHVGGDERPKGPWEQCDRCQKRMREENLPDGRVLQDRFLKRVQGIVRAHGKKMIGWDELEQESVLDQDYTVMAWNSVQAGINAARKGYPVIMTPSPFTYYDLSYNENPDEPGLRWAGVISLEKAYSFDPKPAELESAVAGRILGVHGCLWSETLVTPERPDYMAFPRLCALAEIGWTPQKQRSWPEFEARVYGWHLPRLDAAGIAYRIPPPVIQGSGQHAAIVPPYAGAEVRYTLDGSEPARNSGRYQKPLNLAKGEVLKARTFRPNGRASRTVSWPNDQAGK